MDRSIKKSIPVNELRYIFQLNNIQVSDRSRLIPDLFENPQSENTYLLKEDIRTIKDIKERISSIINHPDYIEAITNSFSVSNDLIIPPELRTIFLSNLKLAFFVGAGVSKLLEIPLWDDLANNVVDCLQDNYYLNHTEASQLRNEKYTAKQVMSIFHQIVKDKNLIDKFYKDHFYAKENKAGNPYELLFKIEQALAKPIIKVSTNIDLEWEKILKEYSQKQKQEQNQQGQAKISRSVYNRTQYSDFTNEQKITDDILFRFMVA